MRVRRNYRALSAEERQRFVEAFLELKARGRYDEYVHWHHHVMHPTVMPWEPTDANYRNGAHRGPAFLPWHREYLLQVDEDLQQIDPRITIPYWDWTEDATLDDPRASPIWSDDFMGGDGDPADGYQVASGPFAYSGGRWPIPANHDGPALTRRLGGFPNVDTLPTAFDLTLAMAESFYDTPPFNNSPFTVGFRNRLEGWVTQRGDSRVATLGSQLHNRVHLWVGGAWTEAGRQQFGSMVHMTSPNDPVFFLHHCFVDKVWADWQERQRLINPAAAPHYAPGAEGPPGHNLTDTLRPWTRTVQDVLDIRALDYTYEVAPSEHRVLDALASPESFVTPFSMPTPFEA
jgi:tyrosinase